MPIPARNRRVTLARYLNGEPQPEDFRIEDSPSPQPAPGRIIVQNRFISFDPGVRDWLSNRASYMDPVRIGETVRGMTLGQVIASDTPAYPEGSLVRAMAGWEELSSIASDALGIEPVRRAPGVPLEHYMGLLGPTGLTAWVGFERLGGIRPGETVLVSAAAGAVGSVAGQIAKLRGARVIGIASGADKAARLTQLGYDAVIDRRAPDLRAAIAAAAPDGISFYFDNVGGAVLEAVLPNMALFGRIAACGMIADYNSPESSPGVRGLFAIVTRRLTVQGFFTFDDMALCARGQAELEGWVREGRLHALTDIRNGLDAAPRAFIDLMTGRTTGKTLVRL